MSETKTSKRPRLRFSLRAFFVLLTVFCLWLGWRVSVVNQIRSAVSKIERLGGSVLYGPPSLGKMNDPSPYVDQRLNPPDWLGSWLWLSEDHLPRVVYLGERWSNHRLSTTEAEAYAVSYAPLIAALPSVRQVSFSGLAITGDCLEEVAMHDHVTGVDLTHTCINLESLRVLLDKPDLSYLNLDHCQHLPSPVTGDVGDPIYEELNRRFDGLSLNVGYFDSPARECPCEGGKR